MVELKEKKVLSIYCNNGFGKLGENVGFVELILMINN